MPSWLNDRWRATRTLVEQTAASGSAHNVPMLAAAMSFYLLVTLAPLALLFSLTVQVLAQNAIIEGVTATVPTVSETIVEAFTGGSVDPLVLFVAFAAALYGASSVFGQFVSAITLIWEEPEPGNAVRRFARRRGLGLLILIVLALALVAGALVGAVGTALLSELTRVTAELGLPEPDTLASLWPKFALDFVTGLLTFWVAFTVVPLPRLRPRDTASGAIIAAIAYTVGQFGLSIYLANTSRVSLPGSMGTLIALLLWVYYTSLIALYGAELSRALVLRKMAGRGSA